LRAEWPAGRRGCRRVPPLTTEAAFARGTAPITLIDGEKLLDLLIEHGIGVRKRPLEILAVDADAFTDLEAEG
jgi:restriction endonuclease Mrr